MQNLNYQTFDSGRYQTCMFLAQLVLTSWRKISASQYQMILDFMEKCLQMFTWNDIRNIDVRLGTTYETFLPFIRLIYSPDPDTPAIPGLGANLPLLQIACLNIVILGLQATLGIIKNYEVMAKEGLLDYIICAPFHVPSCLKAKAQMLVTMVLSCQNGTFQPPSLTCLAKAKLARMHFGLELVLSASAIEIADRLL